MAYYGPSSYNLLLSTQEQENTINVVQNTMTINPTMQVTVTPRAPEPCSPDTSTSECSEGPPPAPDATLPSNPEFTALPRTDTGSRRRNSDRTCPDEGIRRQNPDIPYTSEGVRRRTSNMSCPGESYRGRHMPYPGEDPCGLYLDRACPDKGIHIPGPTPCMPYPPEDPRGHNPNMPFRSERLQLCNTNMSYPGENLLGQNPNMEYPGVVLRGFQRDLPYLDAEPHEHQCDMPFAGERTQGIPYPVETNQGNPYPGEQISSANTHISYLGNVYQDPPETYPETEGVSITRVGLEGYPVELFPLPDRVLSYSGPVHGPLPYVIPPPPAPPRSPCPPLSPPSPESPLDTSGRPWYQSPDSPDSPDSPKSVESVASS